MAAASPVKSNSGATGPTTAATPSTATAAVTPPTSNASKSLRGLNKPKCIKCGNVARSRCPYQSCKNCCAKAQNPCHIHVLKGNSSFPDKPPSSSSPLLEQQSSEGSHSGNSSRLRQLSNNFAQFSNLRTPLRSRKPLTRKDAQRINEWRFLKLKEFKDENIQSETQAFDRYMQNVGLLEEVFLVSSAADDQIQTRDISGVNSSSDGENAERIVDGFKLKLRSNPVRTDNFRKRIQYTVDQCLRKLEGKFELVDGTDGFSDVEGLGSATKKSKTLQGERETGLSELNDKLNKARNEDDLKACEEMASQIFGWNANNKMEPATGLFSDKTLENDSSRGERFRSFQPKWVIPATIDQETVCRIDAQFSSLEEIEDL